MAKLKKSAKPKTSAKKPSVNSTTDKVKARKPKSERKLTRSPTGAARDCCIALAPHMDRLLSILETIANAPAGTMFVAEDGVIVPITPLAGAGNWHYDPLVSPLPYWEPV